MVLKLLQAGPSDLELVVENGEGENVQTLAGRKLGEEGRGDEVVERKALIFPERAEDWMKSFSAVVDLRRFAVIQVCVLVKESEEETERKTGAQLRLVRSSLLPLYLPKHELESHNGFLHRHDIETLFPRNPILRLSLGEREQWSRRRTTLSED